MTNVRTMSPRLLRLASLRAILVVIMAIVVNGCTALTNPIADGVPVRLVPPEILGPSKTCYQTLPLNLLKQTPPGVYKLDSGDVLGVFIDGFLGEKNVPLPVHVAPLLQTAGQNRLDPSAGYPVRVQEDGAIALPGVAKIAVKGMTVDEAREAIRNTYFKKELVRKENDRFVVTLLQQRHTQVMVFRQEAQTFMQSLDGPMPGSKRNTGHLVDLPAYHNDVLNALARTGGLPELDAYNEVIIYRQGMPAEPKKADPKGGKVDVNALGISTHEAIRIPLRVPAGATLPFGRDDVILRGGDVVFLEARDEQVFFTAGLLPPGKYLLPRDRDLDVIEAISQVRGPFYNGAFGGNNLSGTLIQPGLGSPSPSLCVVLRRVPDRGQVPIVVDLRAALKHPQERLVIRPGDVLVLQEKPAEAVARYMTQTFFNFNMFYNVFNTSRGFGIIDIASPDRLPGRVGNLQTLP